MSCAKSRQISGSDAVVIPHIGIGVVSDHRVGASLLRAGHVNGASGHLHRSGVDVHRVDSLSILQPAFISCHGHGK